MTNVLEDAPWLNKAIEHAGLTKEDGKLNAAIGKMMKLVHDPYPGDQDEWCSAFVNACLTRSGIRGTNNATAASWLKWGQRLGEPRIGCITVVELRWEESKNVSHHVGFYVGQQEHPVGILLLGGNQSSKVSISIFRNPGRTTVLRTKKHYWSAVAKDGYRWPRT
jgi:uncharacterized protein (TIGR02594 family)